MGKNTGPYGGSTADAGTPSLYGSTSRFTFENKAGAAAASGTCARPGVQRRKRFGITLYLTLYNWIAACAWSYVLFLVLINLLKKGVSSTKPAVLYKNVELPLMIAQGMQILEIFHAVLGLVRSSAFITFTQVFSRVQLVLFLFRLSNAAYSSFGVVALLLAWSLAELIRYPFFGVQEMLACLYTYSAAAEEGKKGGGAAAGEGGQAAAAPAVFSAPPSVEAPALLKWLRYSGFIVLYPVGITGEVLCMLTALPQLKKHTHFPTAMPNFLNFEVNLYYCYIVLLAAYIPGSVMLYTHMMQQRKKCLYGRPSAAADDDRKKRQ